MEGLIVIERGDVFCRLVKGSPTAILPAVRVKDPNARFRVEYRRGSWDGYVRFYDPGRRCFPTGLLPAVRKHLKDKAIPNRLIDPHKDRKPVSLDGITEDMLFGVTLRDYQIDAIKRGISEERGFYWIATNGGKSSIIAGLCKHLNDHTGAQCVVIVPTTSLCSQLAKDLADMTGLTVGRLGGGVKSVGEITVMTGQSAVKGSVTYADMQAQKTRNPQAASRYDKRVYEILQRASAIFVDEGHRAAATTWRCVLSDCRARFRFGLTGSKNTGDAIKNFTLDAYLGPVLVRIRNKQLVNRGISAQAFVFAVTDPAVFVKDHTCPKMVKVKRRHPVTGRLMESVSPVDPRERYTRELKSLLEDRTYNDAIVRMCEAMAAGGVKPLVFTDYIKHLGELSTLATKRKLNVVPIWGEVPADERMRRIGVFTDDPRAMMIASSVFDEGVNAPAIGAMVFTSGGKSIRRVLQRAGRGMRKKSGLNVFALIDMTTYNGEYLAKHAFARLKVYKSEGYRIVDVPDVVEFCRKARLGWEGLLGKERCDSLRTKQSTN